MRSFTFIVFAAVAVVFTAVLHIYSYFREVPPALLTTVKTGSVLLFFSLAAVSLWEVRGGKLPEAVNEHWRHVMLASPRVLWFVALLAWLSGFVAGCSTLLDGESAAVHFNTAWCLLTSTMVLSYAIGLRRHSAAATPATSGTG